MIKSKKGWDNEVADFFNQHQIVPFVNYEVSDDQSVLALVKENIGINIMPKLVLDHQITDNITLLDFEQKVFRIIGLGMTERMSPATSIFVSIVTNMYQTRCFESKICIDDSVFEQ